MLKLEDIPIELLLDHLLPFLPISDLLRLGCTNRFFSTLCNDDTFWHRKLLEDFNFSDEDTARSTGWKFIYRGLSRPRTFMWGESSKGRLGRTQFPAASIRDVPFPVELSFGSVRIVHLAAAGMSFFALDSKGNLYAWGTLNGLEFALQMDGFSAPGKTAHTPLRLDLPDAIRTISCGRLHATALDEKLHIWNFLSFGRPFRLVTSFLDGTSLYSTPIQVEAGWSFSSALTKGGDVFVWWPFSGEMKQSIDARNAVMDQEGLRAREIDNEVIPCAHWELPKDPYKLPELPPLPQLVSGGLDTDVRLVKIAALDSHLIGLTNYGHVLKISVQASDLARREGWVYLPHFSESEKIKQHVTSAAPHLTSVSLRNIRVTHVSAQFQTFVAYSTGSSSVVLMGSHENDENTEPRVLPALQNINVISVVLGDYHFGALTSTGKLYTWGQYSHGALGLGDPTKIEPGQPGGYRTEQQRQHALQRRGPHPPGVTEPSEVRFDHGETRRRKRFCFAAASAGWHMGALVIDLEPDDPDNDGEADSVPMPGQFPTGPGPSQPTHSTGPPRAWGSVFRVGFAGRGAARGGFNGQRGH